MVPMLDFTKKLIWTVPHVLSEAECAALIARIDASEPEVATINAPEGVVLNTSIRNNTRVIFDDAGFAAELFGRIREHVPDELMGMRSVGANERFRCYKYEVGQRFALHLDGSFVRDERERSLLTFMIYLNEGFEGGETAFPDADEVVIPRTGTALFFQHPIEHEGCPVRRGVKYALRTDVMYRRADAMECRQME